MAYKRLIKSNKPTTNGPSHIDFMEGQTISINNDMLEISWPSILKINFFHQNGANKKECSN